MDPVASVSRSGDRVDAPGRGGFTLDVFEHMFEHLVGLAALSGTTRPGARISIPVPRTRRPARVWRGEASHPGRLPPSPSSPGVLAHQRAVTNQEERPDDPTV